MLRVLILAYDFYPLPSIAAQRPYSWYKYLPKWKARVTVITRQWPKEINDPADYLRDSEIDTTVIESSDKVNYIYSTPYKSSLSDRLILRFGINRFALFRKFISFITSIFQFLFFSVDSKSGIYYEAEKYLESNKVDYIIATGEPLILFRYAHLLSKKYEIPWAPDYRDAFTNYQGGKFKRPFLQKVLQRVYIFFEKKYVTGSRFIITAAPGYAKIIARAFPDKAIHVVYNGYDIADEEGLRK
ncbi:MAG: hypothetical protein JWO06_1072, partial [Bacteroidota bacterium]|nr:hypothetical protein [Bacteroidota bacterium]